MTPDLPVDDMTSSAQLKARRLEMAYWVFMALLASVNVQMLIPLGLSTVRRPPDNLVNNNNQLTLLIAGALCTGAGYFLGTQSDSTDKDKEGPEPPEPFTGDDPNIVDTSLPENPLTRGLELYDDEE